MAKRGINSNPTYTEATYLIKPKINFKSELEIRISKANEIIKNLESNRNLVGAEGAYSSWNDYNLELLKQSFSLPDNEYRESYNNAGVSKGIRVSTIGGSGPSKSELIRKFISKLNKKIHALENLVQKIELLKASESDEIIQNKNENFNMSQVFIVHGHDDTTKNEVARFIENLGFTPIILHEQASSGRTIIEKIEEYSNVGFGIVLYTPCDVGSKKGNESNLQNRARQNVVFEHGYLIGKIGRENVCALVKGDIETPNDISGVVYISLESEWKFSLAKEMKNSGYKVDMNLAIS